MSTEDRVKDVPSNKPFFEVLYRETLPELYVHRNTIKAMIQLSEVMHRCDFDMGRTPTEEELIREHRDLDNQLKLERTLNTVNDRIKELEERDRRK